MVHERINPYTDNDIMKLSRLAHIKRYQKASEIIGSRKKVIDAGCGVGYGSSILFGGGNKVIGVDSDIESVCEAINSYGVVDGVKRDNLDFFHINLNNGDFLTHSPVDAITCFEVLEHVKDPLFVLNNFRNSLAKSGKLLISVPNANNAANNNDYHINDFSPESLEEVLNEGGFVVNDKLGQYPVIGFLAGAINKLSGYNSNTNKKSGLIPKVVDSIPFLPEIFSNFYSSNLAVSTSRSIYFVAEKK